MSSLNISNIDEITMRLVHYFVTKENYQPIIVNGLDNEIWLENSDKKYEVIRINNNYIHNKEQLDFDIFKAKTIVKQIKKKTFSFNCNTLSIFLNLNDSVDLKTKEKHIDLLTLNDVEELETSKTLSSLFPELKNDVIDAKDDMDFFIHITSDINNKTEEKNKLFEKTFRKKPILVTYALIVINVIIFLLSLVGIINVNDFAMNLYYIKQGEWYRLLTAAFFHADIIHILCNMYCLYVVGTQLENVLGKVKFIIVYIVSAIAGSLMSAALNGMAVTSIGASGAIFGIMGAMLYFGYHYRLYLGSVMMSQIVPLIILNLLLGFMIPNVDNYAHIGGLIGGLFAGMAVGVEGKSSKSDSINGIVVTLILLGFLTYVALFMR